MSTGLRSKELLIVVIATVLVALAGIGCSSGEEAGDVDNQPTVPAADGDACQDPVGDLSSDASAAGVGTDPPGVDIVRASAVRNDDETLDVTFTTAGPVTATPGTIFVVAQNSAGSPLGFEIRAGVGESGQWGVNAITWSPDEKSTSLPVSPAVSGDTISFTVPMEALPPLALYLQFGSTTEVEGVGTVIDDCSSLTTAPTVSTG
jgi:hypothetical protein